MLTQQPGDEVGEIVIWGNPWHGVVLGGELTTTVGGITREWLQPDYGDCFLFQVPEMPAVTRSPEQLAQDEAKGHEWRNYALLTGWFDRQLYGKNLNPLAGARNDLKYYYASQPGDVWQVSLAGLSVSGDAASGNVTLRKSVFGSTETKSLPVSASWTDTFGTSQHFTVHEVTPDGSRAIIAIWRQKYTHRTDYLWYKQSGTRLSHGMAYSGNSSGVLNGSFIAGPDALLLLEIARVGDDHSATLTVLKGPEEMYPVPYETELASEHAGTVVQAYKQIVPGSDDDMDFEVGIFLQGTAPADYIEWDSEVFMNDVLTGAFEVIIGAYFDDTNVVKYVTVEGSSTRSNTYTISGLPYGPETIDTGVAGYFEANGTNRYHLLNEGQGTGTVLLKAGGVVLSTLTIDQEWTIDAAFGVTTYSDSATLLCDGDTLLSGTIDELGEGLTVSGPFFGDNKVYIGAGPLLAELHLTRFCAGAYGFIMNRYQYSVEAGTGTHVDEVYDWYIHKVHSITAGTSSEVVGTVGNSTYNVQRVFHEFKASHHPVTGEILTSGGMWV